MPNPFQLRRVVYPAGAPGASVQGNTWPLDDHRASLVAAWSVARRLLGSYSGPLIRVRRSNDYAEADIYPTAEGGLDQTALVAFRDGDGSRNVHVTKVYDQLELHDLAQADTLIQPLIIGDDGIETMSGGAPCVRFTGYEHMISTLPAIVDHATLFACLNDVSGAWGGTDSPYENYLSRTGVESYEWKAGAELYGVAAYGHSDESANHAIAFRQTNESTRVWNVDGGPNGFDDGAELSSTFGVRGLFCRDGASADGLGKVSEMIIAASVFSDADVQAIQATQEGLI